MSKKPASPDDLSEKDRFYHVFGKALAAWAQVEYGLSLWFAAWTELDHDTAQNIFFSGRAFQSRSDMLWAALEPAPLRPPNLSPEWREFVVDAQNKAASYNSKRNRLAHGIVHPTALDMDGHPKEWRLKELADWQTPAGLSHSDLTTMAHNFQQLADILRLSFAEAVISKGQPTQFLQRLRELPNEADSTQLSQKQKARLRPPRS